MASVLFQHHQTYRLKDMKRLLCILFFFLTSLAQAETIMVSAAASLTDAFTEIGQEFEKQHPNTKVEFNFAAAGAILQQIIQGAPVDVFVSADQEIMNKAQTQGVIKQNTRVNFVANQLVVITPLNSQLVLNSLDDVAKQELVVLGNPNTTPIGRYIQEEMQKRNLWERFQTTMVLSETVRQSLNYVARAEVDAGFVFMTDAKTAQDKVKVAFVVVPEKGHEKINPFVYPIAQVQNSSKAEATQFIEYVLSLKGQAILSKHGFLPLH